MSKREASTDHFHVWLLTVFLLVRRSAAQQSHHRQRSELLTRFSLLHALAEHNQHTDFTHLSHSLLPLPHLVSFSDTGGRLRDLIQLWLALVRKALRLFLLHILARSSFVEETREFLLFRHSILYN